MKERVQFVRLAWLLLLLFFIGKLVVNAAGGSYDLGNRLFAMVPMTVHLCLIWGAMTRAFRGQGAGSAFLTGATIAIFAQVLIFGATLVSYALDLSTPFNNPIAIVGEDRAVSFGEALGARAFGIVVNSILGGIGATIGWALGGLLPSRETTG